MGVKMFGVLLACVWLVAGSPLHPWSLIPHKAIIHGSYIRHYSAVWYDTAALREHRSRSRRDTSASGHPGDGTLNLRLHALDRVFKMRLTRDTSLFDENVVFEGSNGRQIAFDPLHAYSGTLEDDENSSVHGIVTEEGLFDGTITTASGEIYIEPASRYSPLVCHRQDGEDKDATGFVHHHTIAYRSADVNVPRRDGYPCASELLRENTLNELRTNRTWSGYLGDTMRPLYQHLNEENSRAKPGFYPKDVRKKDPLASSHNLELLDRLYRERYSRVLRKRTSVDPKKTTCMLYLQADHTFFNHYKSEEASIEVMTRHVQRVNSIYRYTEGQTSIRVADSRRLGRQASKRDGRRRWYKFKSGMAGQEAVMREARWYFYQAKYRQTSYTERHSERVEEPQRVGAGNYTLTTYPGVSRDRKRASAKKRTDRCRRLINF